MPPDQLVRLPKPGDADSARQFWTKVGAGEKPEDYKLEVVQGAKPEDVAFIQGLAHKHMLPKEGVAAFVKEFDAEILKRTEAAEKAAAAEAGREYDAQIAAWGSAATANVELGRRALAAIGWNEEQARAIQGALGVRAFMEGMVKIGQGLAEHGTSPTGGKPAGAVLSPADAQAEIKRLKADPTWSKNYLNGGAAEKAEMDRLHKLAYPTGAVGGGAIVVGGQAFARP